MVKRLPGSAAETAAAKYRVWPRGWTSAASE
jgi:hypothetical protein